MALTVQRALGCEMGTSLPLASFMPWVHSPWKLKPLPGCSSPLPVQCGVPPSSISTLDQMTSVLGLRRRSIRYGSPSQFTSATIPKMPHSGLIERMLPSAAIHIWARSSPTNWLPAMAVVVLPQPLGAAPQNQVTRPPGPSMPVMNMCSESCLPPPS